MRIQALTDDACAAAGRLYAASLLEKSENLTTTTTTYDTSDKTKERLRTAVLSTLDHLESSEELDAKDWDLGDICAAILPLYWGFRFPNEEWREGRPKLSRFVKEMERKWVFSGTDWNMK